MQNCNIMNLPENYNQKYCQSGAADASCVPETQQAPKG